MFGSIGLPELILIFVVVLLLFGPDKLPHVAKTMGKTLREFRTTVDEAKSVIKDEIEKSTGGSELKEMERELRQVLRTPLEPPDPPVQSPPPPATEPPPPPPPAHEIPQ